MVGIGILRSERWQLTVCDLRRRPRNGADSSLRERQHAAHADRICAEHGARLTCKPFSQTLHVSLGHSDHQNLGEDGKLMKRIAGVFEPSGVVLAALGAAAMMWMLRHSHWGSELSLNY